MKKFLFLLIIYFLTIQCERVENIKAYQVKIWYIPNYGNCECHIRIDSDIKNTENFITCYHYGKYKIDTLYFNHKN